jgi:nicotinamide-nucleotide amidase
LRHTEENGNAVVKVELINTGSELLLGRVLNTHQQWLCRRLSDLGYRIERQVAVPDTGTAIQEAVREALSRADLVITTGGLGPTSDDLTRDLIAQLLGRKLHMDEAVRAEIRNFFVRRNRPQPVRTEVQAQVPDGAVVFPNAVGTAPGLAMEVPAGGFRESPSWLIMLPGPPRELHPMFLQHVLPFLRKVAPVPEVVACRTLRTCGIGESMVEERIAKPLEHLVQQGLELGYCARTGEVDVRLLCYGKSAAEKVAEAESIVRDLVGEHVFGTDDERLEEVIVRLLTDRKQTLAIAESCTGGHLTNRITNVPGASAVLLAGLVTYSNEAKQTFLGVKPATLEAHGAVSKEVAREMARGACDRTGADYAIATTGIAGPSGGSEDKPVGTVFIGFASRVDVLATKHFNPYDRETFKMVTSQQALEILRRRVLRSA